MLGLNTESKRPLVAIVALLAIVISVWAIFSTRQSPRTAMNNQALKGLGEALAQEAVKAVGDHGQIVLVVNYVDKSGGSGAPGQRGDRRAFAEYAALLQTQLDGFKNGLRAHPGVVVAATERVELGLAPEEEKAKGMDAHSSYFALATKYPNADAIVSLIDAPNLDPEDLRRLPTRLPKIITVSNIPGVPNLRRLFAAGVLHTAILPRWEQPPETAKPRTPAEWFARNFIIVTPATIDRLPPPPVLN